MPDGSNQPLVVLDDLVAPQSLEFTNSRRLDWTEADQIAQGGDSDRGLNAQGTRTLFISGGFKTKTQSAGESRVSIWLVATLVVCWCCRFLVERGTNNTMIDLAKNEIALYSEALEDYALDIGTYPDINQGLNALYNRPRGVEQILWKGPYLPGVRWQRDPWGQKFVYQIPSKRPNRDFDICSLGKPGSEGRSEDLICN